MLQSLDPHEGIGLIGSLIFTIPLAILSLAVSVFVILQLRKTSSLIVITTLIFGGTSFLVVAGTYFLWAIGGIAFYTSATLWALGLALVNLLVARQVLKRLPPSSPNRAAENFAPREPSEETTDLEA